MDRRHPLERRSPPRALGIGHFGGLVRVWLRLILHRVTVGGRIIARVGRLRTLWRFREIVKGRIDGDGRIGRLGVRGGWIGQLS